MYATPLDLLARQPAQDLAEAASTDPDITGELLARSLSNTDDFTAPANTGPALTAALTLLRQALEDASAEIDSYLGTRYAVPVVNAPLSLKSYCLDIALFRLFDNHAPDPSRDAPRRVRYEAVLAWLRKVAEGKIALPATAASSRRSDDGDVDYSAPDRVFSRDRLAGY